MKELELPNTPFFARILSADLACPRCDEVTRIGTRGTRRAEAGMYVDDRVWNPLTCRWRCPSCKLTLRLGVVAHPLVKRSSREKRRPPDSAPNMAQALKLRAFVSRIVAERWRAVERKGRRPPAPPEVNRIGQELELRPEDDQVRAGEEFEGAEILKRRPGDEDAWDPEAGEGEGEEGEEEGD